MTLEFRVTGQHISWLNNTEHVVADSRNYLKAKFTFSEEWTYPVTVLFKGRCKTVPVLLAQAGEEITVPPEVLKGPLMLVSCYCGDLITTDSTSVKIDPSGYTEDTSPPVPPPPNLYQELLNRVDTAQISAEANAEKTAADREAVAALSQTVMADITQTVGNAEAAVEAKAEEAKSSVESAVSEARESIQTSAQSAKVDIVQTAQASVQSASDEIASAAESAKSAAVQSITSVGETAKQAVVSEKDMAVKVVQDTSAAEQQTIQSTVSETIDQNLAWEEIVSVTLTEDADGIIISQCDDGTKIDADMLFMSCKFPPLQAYADTPAGHKQGTIRIRLYSKKNNPYWSIETGAGKRYTSNNLFETLTMRRVDSSILINGMYNNENWGGGGIASGNTMWFPFNSIDYIDFYAYDSANTALPFKSGTQIKLYRRLKP